MRELLSKYEELKIINVGMEEGRFLKVMEAFEAYWGDSCIEIRGSSEYSSKAKILIKNRDNIIKNASLTSGKFGEKNNEIRFFVVQRDENIFCCKDNASVEMAIKSGDDLEILETLLK
ncbi:hypothetical protein HNV12_11705 [Methanococcoides sp. SA1]|nr:hypothetical protein [Methanococcoides sp. SA1]